MKKHVPPAGRRLLLIGFDSAAPPLVEEGMRDGWLPNMARLRERGAYGRLRSTSDWLVSSHWASFSMGTPPNEHGCYHFLQWRADEMALKRPDPAWMVREPFWRELAERGTKVVVLDAPYTPAPRTKSYTGVELCGWATNELIFPPYAHPGRMKEVARRTYGRSLRFAGAGPRERALRAPSAERAAPHPGPARGDRGAVGASHLRSHGERALGSLPDRLRSVASGGSHVVERGERGG